MEIERTSIRQLPEEEDGARTNRMVQANMKHNKLHMHDMVMGYCRDA